MNGNLDMLRFAKGNRFDLQAYLTSLFQIAKDENPKNGQMETWSNTQWNRSAFISAELKDAK